MLYQRYPLIDATILSFYVPPPSTYPSLVVSNKFCLIAPSVRPCSVFHLLKASRQVMRGFPCSLLSVPTLSIRFPNLPFSLPVPYSVQCILSIK